MIPLPATPPSSAAVGETIGTALLRVAGVSWRSAAASGALLLALLVAGWWTHSYNWLMLLIAWSAGAVAAHGLLHLGRVLLPPQAGWGWLWALLPIAVAAGAGAAVVAYRLAIPYFSMRLLDNVRVFFSCAVFLALVLAVPLLYARRQAHALYLTQLERAALAAQLKSLQAQVEPHFLYNTLANTRYLARHQPERAVTMLDHLIGYLRAALPDMRTETSTAGRECELASHYLSLMAVRFGERLRFTVTCPDALREARLPPLMLMSLVENAVQHGVEPQPGDVSVRIEVSAKGDTLHVLVADSGAGLGHAVLGSGVGLRNVRERLAVLYGPQAAVELRANSKGETEAELRLPLVMENHD